MQSPQAVHNAREELTAELTVYAAEKTAAIDTIAQAVHDKGAVGAVAPEALIENARHATVSESLFLEATVRSDDKAPINFLERGMRAARAVCRLVDGNRVALGSGFLIGPGLLLTNNHVLSSADDAEGMWAEFDYEEDADEVARAVQRHAIMPDRFVTSPRDQLDFTIVGLADVSREGGTLAERGWLPLDERRNKIFEGQPIVIIQHPDGQMKQICLFDSVLTFRDDDGPFILYSTDTAEGTSGSPCFNRFWQVVGLHHASLQTGDTGPEGRPIAINRGIRISAILQALKTGRGISGDPAVANALYRALADRSIQRDGRPFAPLPVAPSHGGVAASDPLFEASRTVVRVRTPADFLDDRAGYQPDFLGDGALALPLPQLADWLASDAAPLIDAPGESELRYQHFSIVMSRSRKLALLTATNVDGASLRSIGRKDRDPDRPLSDDVNPEAAADRWFFDPRIARDHQLEPDLYDRTSFDFGHLVRRLDPVWGDARTLRIANDDTFYMTNCAPHESRFHRTRRGSDISWSTLEDLVLDAARESGKRFTILTGPVLDARDPIVGGIRIPTAFWKIAAFADAGRLKAYGYMLWQTSEVATMDKPRFEGLEKLDEERPFAIREIARLTGLDFGPLFAADILG